MFRELLKKDYVLFDGAMGTMLQAAGLRLGEIPEVLNITRPELLADIHRAYIEAGAQVIYANTFGANGYKLAHCGYGVAEIVRAGIANARRAVKESGRQVCVALDIGPIGRLLQPSGTLSFEEAYEIYREVVLAGADADVIIFETMTDLLEIKAGILAAKENSALPVAATMTFEQNMRTFTGCSVSAMALTLQGLGVEALGMNCSLGPGEMEPIVKELSKWCRLPLIVKPNAGLPDPATNAYNVTAVEFAGQMEKMLPYGGVRCIGGCCGTTPEFIRETGRMLANRKPCPNRVRPRAAVCSSTRTVTVDQPRIIGERINPTGKKLFKEALQKGDMDYILNQALEQAEAGADILDVNVGLPGIDEKEMMLRTVKALQSITDVPLQIDSTRPEVIEAALRAYNGKPVVNSVNGEEESMEAILPLVKKYGAAVIGLCLDKDGIPSGAKERFAIAKKIAERAAAMGIPREDVYIDCLTLTASAEQAAVAETLRAVRMVKEELGLKTVLGVSNISFGLPNRELVNHIFLTMALTNGLDLSIINPNNEAMTGAVRAYKLLANIDRNSADYIKAYGNQPAAEQSRSPVKKAENPKEALSAAIENGLKNEGAQLAAQLLEHMEAMEIVNDVLIPALDRIGTEFEKGRIFLPQLIMSAGVAQGAFEALRKQMASSHQAPASKGKIVIATVKGDVHDIGKNIVKVLLENYGYEVIDLGKDVEPQAVADAVRRHEARLVGLSALMTTTLASMEKTIALLHENGLDCKIMVGGAVLTKEYAMEIHADYYAKDAKESVDIAKKVLG